MGCGRTRRISPNTRMPLSRSSTSKKRLRHLLVKGEESKQALDRLISRRGPRVSILWGGLYSAADGVVVSTVAPGEAEGSDVFGLSKSGPVVCSSFDS